MKRKEDVVFCGGCSCVLDGFHYFREVVRGVLDCWRIVLGAIFGLLFYVEVFVKPNLDEPWGVVYLIGYIGLLMYFANWAAMITKRRSVPGMLMVAALLGIENRAMDFIVVAAALWSVYWPAKDAFKFAWKKNKSKKKLED